MKNNSLLGDLSKAMLVMSEGERDHFSFLVNRLMRCYIQKDQKAAVFMREDDMETATLTCVNADEKELHEMIYFVNEFMGVQTSMQKKSAMSLN